MRGETLLIPAEIDSLRIEEFCGVINQEIFSEEMPLNPKHEESPTVATSATAELPLDEKLAIKDRVLATVAEEIRFAADKSEVLAPDVIVGCELRTPRPRRWPAATSAGETPTLPVYDRDGSCSRP